MFFDEEYMRYVYLISDNSKDEYIKTLSYDSYSFSNKLVKHYALKYSDFFQHFFDNLETNIPEAYKQYMRMKKLERIIGQI